MVIQYEIATFDLLSCPAQQEKEWSTATPQGMETAMRLVTVAEETGTALPHALPADVAIMPVAHFLNLVG